MLQGKSEPGFVSVGFSEHRSLVNYFATCPAAPFDTKCSPLQPKRASLLDELPCPPRLQSPPIRNRLLESRLRVHDMSCVLSRLPAVPPLCAWPSRYPVAVSDLICPTPQAGFHSGRARTRRSPGARTVVPARPHCAR